jgi:hypothetical protein
MIPDRRGNNRVDSLRNIVRDPRIALLFLIPGSGSTLRVNGRAALSTDADLLASFRIDGRTPNARTARVGHQRRPRRMTSIAVARRCPWRHAVVWHFQCIIIHCL